MVALTVSRRGTYDDKDLSFGIESRSLKGCYELIQVSRLALSRALPAIPFPLTISLMF